LFGVSILSKINNTGTTTDMDGMAQLAKLPDGQQVFVFSHVGYEDLELTFSFPKDNNGQPIVLLVPSEESLDEITVESTRANRSIQNIPTRIEALTEEIDEAASMEPSRIAHLITHSTGVQVQTTSAASNGGVVRIQGLNGRYTKLLKDGFPMYGGFSGSLDILQIPPLDLRQVEFVKGASSTLHGSGAIAGVLNLLSKDAKTDEVLLHLNHSSIGSNDLNAFVGKRFGKWGFTNLASYQLHKPYDADDDGYSDLPDVSKFNFNPKLFFNPDKNTQFYFGGTVSREFRNGGDMDLLERKEPSDQHFYLDAQESNRYTTQFKVDRKWAGNQGLTLKNSLNFFDRYINIRKNQQGARAIFGGKQTASFTELSYDVKAKTQQLILGANYITDDFKENNYNQATQQQRDEKHQTAALFVDHIWDAKRFLSIESGLRGEWNKNSSAFGEDDGQLYFLPRISALVKYSDKLTSRIGGGLGYRPLTIFNEESEPLGFENLAPVNYLTAKVEKSVGLNADVVYRNAWGDGYLLTINQMFFYNNIANPTALELDAQEGTYSYVNSTSDIESKGFETQVKFTFWKITWFLGYTYTDAVLASANDDQLLVLMPKHSIKGDFLFVEDNKWRIGLDYEYKSQQRLSSGAMTKDLFMTGIVIERTLGNFVLFFNAENMTDARQSKYESLKTGPYATPQYTEVWAPLDGRFFNFGLKIKL
jgi:outer membrane receptor for ferrienterochelin and colicins